MYSHLLDPPYNNLLSVVAKDRNLTIKTLKKYADGKIYIANQVKGILVDKISTLVDIKMAIKKEIAKKEHIAINKIKFYNINMNNQKLPFFKIEVQDTTLKTLANGLHLQ